MIQEIEELLENAKFDTLQEDNTCQVYCKTKTNKEGNKLLIIAIKRSPIEQLRNILILKLTKYGSGN